MLYEELDRVSSVSLIVRPIWRQYGYQKWIENCRSDLVGCGTDIIEEIV